jgi:mono/diheme cytochrome c family protein
MNQKEKQEYLERYEAQKKEGEPFFPDALVRDALISLVVFLVLVVLARFLGAPLEARADPSDTSYTPRPEWYFLFLFQLLRRFPGNLEVVGVIVLPTLVLIALFLLPFLDRSGKRHFRNRPVVTGLTLAVVLAVAGLSIQAVREAPPPASSEQGDATAALYAQNCASCHGPSVTVPPGTDLHRVIAEGRHEGMPAWSGDLTSDQIDALAGFILSPQGSRLFAENCGACHDVEDLVAGDPLQSRQALEGGPTFAPHADVEVPDFSAELSASDRSAVLNFLAAPDGQRLFTLNCSPCHGQAVSFSGTEEELRPLIAQGGLHLEMPPWRTRLSSQSLEALARYVVDPSSAPEGNDLFVQNCADCHGDRVPSADGEAEARQIISSGGAHATMPIWGEILTDEQLDALVLYTLQAARGAPTELGQQLFTRNCASCHGDFGEGGPNPTRAGDVIAPISSREYLGTRDDATLRAIISEGQPDFGMSPFSTANGGPLDDEEIDAIVAFLRSWEANPPVETPPEAVAGPIPLTGTEILDEICARCHGPAGEGGFGPALRGADFEARYNDQQLFDVINLGHEATPMIAWGEILTADQIRQVVEAIRLLGSETPGVSGETPSFTADVLPIFQVYCVACHGSLGGWDASTFEGVMNSGDHAPVVVPGEAQASLLAQKLLGTQTEGAVMPPAGPIPDALIQVILDWIGAGAPDN